MTYSWRDFREAEGLRLAREADKRARMRVCRDALAGIAEPEAWVQECRKLIAAVRVEESKNYPGQFSIGHSVPEHIAAIKARIRAAETGKERG